MREDDLLAVLRELSGRSWAREIRRWVHSTTELPLRELLERHGVAVVEEPSQLAQRLGLRVTESSGLLIKTVLRGGAAEQAGFAAGDEWLGVEIGSTKSAQGWRLNSLDDLPMYVGESTRVRALISRAKMLLRLDLKLPQKEVTWRLAIANAGLTGHWLGGKSLSND